MKKNELKTGMLVETEDKKLALVMLGTEEGDVLVSNGGEDGEDRTTWSPLGSYNENLETTMGSIRNIVKVYSYSNNKNGAKLNTSERKLLWERNIDKIPLTPDYTAIIDRNNKIIQVGCQAIPFSKVEELYKLIKK